jgi:2-polyprenyl-6-methoxyphenol hydroxylase-like FAD-dependent oxidoreductase
LFPGLTAELIAGGAPRVDGLGDMRWCLGGHWFARVTLGVEGVHAGRPFIEAHVRDRLRQDRAVTIVDACDVLGLTSTADNKWVTGVRLLRRADGSAEETLAADLVVDCSGRRSRTPAWLEELGYDPPLAEQLRVNVHYTSRHYRFPPQSLSGDAAILIGPIADRPRGLAMFHIEGDRWIVTAGGFGDHRPPLDPEGFESFIRDLAPADVVDALQQGQPLDDPVAYRYPTVNWLRYDRLRRFPAGLLLAGDAVCSFNPIYGQGMTVAALEAVTLTRLLARGQPPGPDTWFRSIAGTVKVAWDLASGADLTLPIVEGPRSLRVRLLNRYVARLQAAAASDPELAAQFVRVAGLVDQPQRLLAPSTVARVLRGTLSRPAAVPAPAPTAAP